MGLITMVDFTGLESDCIRKILQWVDTKIFPSTSQLDIAETSLSVKSTYGRVDVLSRSELHTPLFNSMTFSSPSSSSPPPSTPRWSYDVFLSFRGTDTRNNFIASLYATLCQGGIKTYRDDNDLERGEIISPTLLKAIEDSMISIIVLSPNYASSSWCLEELTKILECRKTKQQIVLPVFYHVDPSEVRKQKESFGEALANHQERFKEDPKVNEYEFMHKIIQWVDSKIDKSTYRLDIAEYPIGLESRIKELNTKLGIGRNDTTLMIEIYGTGGVGKTTIAKAVFNSIGQEFEVRCFLPNVRELLSREDGLVKLQEKLLRELSGNFGSFNNGSVGGTNVIKHRLCSKRILLILDDVNESRQLKELAGDRNWFGPGSRIVITTRDQHLLTYHQVDSTYEVQGLDNNQAIQLFSWHAFKRDRPDESFVKFTKCIIGYAKGLPLALEVLGSDLRGRSIQEWKSALEKYKRSPHKDIYEILKISYDGLDDNEKDIFLDIACFFKWNSVEYVTKILDGCRFSSSIGIAKLKDKCLINICDQFVEMHDLLQEMGKEIIRQESPKEACERSRLWFHEDVRHVLEENTVRSHK
ncbi:disease resistance protein RUN1-like [Carya illinoinensis]|nr:disease resistance protein RUN1-like [Carya illinoinensis]